MPNHVLLRVAAATAVVSAGLLLTGCSAHSGGSNPFEAQAASAPTRTATPAASPTPMKTAYPVKQFTLPNGETVTVSTNPAVPLPAAVQAQGNALATAAAAREWNGGADEHDTSADVYLTQHLDAFSAATGRDVVAAFRYRGIVGDSGPIQTMWAAVVTTTPGGEVKNVVAGSPDRTLVIDAAEQCVKNNGYDFLTPSGI